MEACLARAKPWAKSGEVKHETYLTKTDGGDDGIRTRDPQIDNLMR